METTFELIPVLLLSIPYGVAADIYGRRLAAFLSILGCTLYPIADVLICLNSDILSPRWIWAVPITTIIGGRAAVFPTMLYTMVSDVAPGSKRYAAFCSPGKENPSEALEILRVYPVIRAGAFVMLTTAPVLGRFASAPALYWLMNYGEWHCVLFAIAAWCPALLIIMTVPDTLHMKDGLEESQLNGPASSAFSQSFADALHSKLQSMSKTAAVSIRQMFWEDSKLCLLLLSTLSLEVGRFLVGILPQYMTERYELAWKEAGMPAVTKDAWVARSGLLLAMTGYIIAGLADRLPLFLVGTVISSFSIGVEPAMRSLLIATARNSGSGALFSTLQVMLSLGIIIAGPIIAASFRLGLHMGQEWLRLPLLLSSIVMAPTATLLFALKFKESSGRIALDRDPDSGENE
ncbi:Major facilitator superfamily domain, general substrate transporter [Akanthomyces lecanii RCEF 1005]|uniref:Major facilitator superfamily domain, general substrate transporter n=1 Tax=Akanthomyces lecanii RCEF 1005 TaxID=1081108 RepID=A0A168I0B4_CORDF|nr:Major facilitator superfamily domain, general substrate transporter [Akanthomyces lecanii RCEF 1005]